MPLTTQAKIWLEKRAALGHALAFPAMHMLQNAWSVRAMRRPSLHRQLMNRFMQSAGKTGMGTLGGEAMIGAQKGIVPEIGLLDREVGTLGDRFGAHLRARGIDGIDLEPEQLARLRQFLRGDFRDLADAAAEHPRTRQTAEAMADAVFPGVQGMVVKKLLSQAANHPAREEALADLEALYKGHDTTGKLLAGMGEQLGRPMPPSTVPAATGRAIQAAGDVAGNAVLAGIDPLTAGMNLGKRGLMSEKLRKVPGVGRAQDWLNKKLVTEPVQQAYRRGLEGGPETGRIGKLLDKYVMNPFTHDAKSMAYGVGRLAKKYNLAPKSAPAPVEAPAGNLAAWTKAPANPLW